MGKAAKIKGYLKDYGFTYTIKKVYNRYIIKYYKGRKYCPIDISSEERKLEEQYITHDDIKISIVVPVYNTPVSYLVPMIESVKKQTYKNWELCLADASDENGAAVEGVVKKLAQKDDRIKYKKLETNAGIGENTNRAAEMATGNYIGLLDHDDLLHPSALYNVAMAIEEHGSEFIYTDELSFDGDTKKVQSINFKPDFSWETFRYNNFICHFTVFKKELFEKAGGYRKEYDGGQDYDLFLRILEQTKKVYHIQKVLYYWRIHSASSAAGVAAKPYIVEAGSKAVEEHLRRTGQPGKVEASKEHGPFYRVTYENKIEKDRVKAYRQGDISLGQILSDIEENGDKYDVLIFVRQGYIVSKELKMIEELLNCLVPKENMASSNTVLDSRGRYLNAGWCYNKKWKERAIPLCKGMPLKEPGYMNRLHFRQSVSLLDGSMLAIKTEIVKKWLEKKTQGIKMHDKEQKDIDFFCRRSWFEMCMEVNKTGDCCVLTPYFPAVISKVKKKELDNAEFISGFEMAEKDRYYNEGMEKFGREYFML